MRRRRNRPYKPADPFYGSAVWKKTRLAVLKRDAWRCRNCGANVRGKGKARVDHIRKRSEFPDLELHMPNLRTLCVDCDNARHAWDKQRRDVPEIGADGFPVDSEWSAS